MALCQGGIGIQPVHEREIGRHIADGINGNDKVVEMLELRVEERVFYPLRKPQLLSEEGGGRRVEGKPAVR